MVGGGVGITAWLGSRVLVPKSSNADETLLEVLVVAFV